MEDGGAPHWLARWCADHLGSSPVTVLFELQQISTVIGLRLADGRDVVVKARSDGERAASCLAAQAHLAERGLWCARPLTPVVEAGALAVHAEELRAGGEVVCGDSPEVAVRCAQAFARLMAALENLSVVPPLPNPRWVRWDHDGASLWPAVGFLDAREQGQVPEHVVNAAVRARARLLSADLPRVLGHGDFEAQNLRWHGRTLWAVHDWDSLTWQPEAALVGEASGAFASVRPPTLAPVDSSAAFLKAYQDERDRAFTTEEVEVAWAASVWPAAHNARWDALFAHASASGSALRTQAGERLRRAGA